MTRQRERFERLSRLFDELRTRDPSIWETLLADRRELDEPLIAEVRDLLSIDRSGAPQQYLEGLLAAARTALAEDVRRHLRRPSKSDEGIQDGFPL